MTRPILHFTSLPLRLGRNRRQPHTHAHKERFGHILTYNLSDDTFFRPSEKGENDPGAGKSQVRNGTGGNFFGRS